MRSNAEFERCADFLARMIEKYGDELSLPQTANEQNCYAINETEHSNVVKHKEALRRELLCA